MGLSLIIIFGIISSNYAEKSFYRAAVLEYVRFSDQTFPTEEIIKHNLKNYEIATKTAAANGADIIVFPEWGLFPDDKSNKSYLQNFAEDIPDPKKNVFNPCIERVDFTDRPVLTQLSCNAKENGIFLVANIADKKVCRNDETCDADNIESCTVQNRQCPDDGVFNFNTNVVFNRDGTLIVRYYKRHLWFEPNMTPTLHQEDAIFETDFGNFTTFVCFELSFKEAVDVVEKYEIVNVAYPTYWFDHVPFAVATSFQQSWAFTNKVNLLASNAHYPGTGTGGSGIYSGSRGALVHSHNPDGQTKLLLSNVPKLPREENASQFLANAKRYVIQNGEAIEVQNDFKNLFKDVCSINVIGLAKDPLNDYRCSPANVSTYEFIKLNKAVDTIELCSNKLCCSLSYKSESLDENYYFGVSGYEFPFYEKFLFGTETCFLARCESENEQTCTNYLSNSNTVFQSVKLTGNFTAKYVYPHAIDNGNQLTSKDEWDFRENSIIYSNKHANSLLFLGLYGRLYDIDKSY